MEVFSLFARLALKSDEFDAGIRNAAKAFGQFHDTTNRVVGKIVQGFAVAGTALAGLGGTAINAGIEYESAFAGVRKTVNATEEQFRKLSGGIRDMATKMPMSASSIAALAESAGQLGIKTENILGFTKVIADLGVATNITGQEGAAQIAKFANIVGMSQDDFGSFGSSIVALGNSFATTEADILNMSMRLSGAGAQVGMSESEILGLATALSSVGIEAEMGGSAISKVLVNMSAAGATSDKLNAILSVENMSLRDMQMLADKSGSAFKGLAHEYGMTGGELKALMKQGGNLENFAKISGMTGAQFRTAFEQDAVGALQSFIGGLANAESTGSSAIEMLQEMGITEVRLRDSLLRAAGAGDLLTDAVKLSNEAWGENTALTKEAEQRYNTMESQLVILKNKATDLGIAFYQSVNNPLVDIIKTAGSMLDKLSEAFSAGGTEGIVSAGGGIVAEIVTGIAQAAPAAVNAATSLVKSFVKGITANSGVILSGAMKAFHAVIDGVKSLMPELVPLSVEILAALASGIITYVEMIYTTGIKVLGSFMQGIADKLPDLIPQAQAAIMNIVHGLSSSLPKILQAGIDIVTQLATGIAGVLPELVPVAVDALLTLIETLVNNIDLLVDAAIAIATALGEGLVNAMPILIARAPEIIGKIASGLIDSIPNLAHAAWDLGVAIVKGVVEGIFSLGDWFRSQVEMFFDVSKRGGNDPMYKTESGRSASGGRSGAASSIYSVPQGGRGGSGENAAPTVPTYSLIASPGSAIQDIINQASGLNLHNAWNAATLSAVSAVSAAQDVQTRAQIEPQINIQAESINIRKEDDIKNVARELYLEIERRNRGAGLATAW